MICGFYIADTHPNYTFRILDAIYGDNTFKFGHSANLESRLRDSTYNTSFPEQYWIYRFSFETANVKEARIIETLFQIQVVVFVERNQ